jgi:hypothetical protein
MRSGPFLTPDDRLKLAIILVVFAADVAWMWTAGYRFDWGSAVKLAAVLPLLFGVAYVYRRWRPNPIFVTMTKETAWLLAFSACAAVLSNLVVTWNLPQIDGAIAAFDHAIGFDWSTYYAFLTGQTWIGAAASLLYVLTLPLIAFAVIALSLKGRTDRASELVLAVMIGALIAILVSGILPSSGALAWFRPDGTGLAHKPIVDLDYKQAFFDLRDGRVPVFSLDGIKGLIAFPSYHATLSVLVVLAFRGMPKYFWPLFVLNAAILATTPVEGGHHLADTLAGVVLAIVAVAIAARLHILLAGKPSAGRSGQWPEATPSIHGGTA